MDISTEFKKDLEQLINKYCVENQSNTPDYILAEFLMASLSAYNFATNARSAWYGKPEGSFFPKASS